MQSAVTDFDQVCDKILRFGLGKLGVQVVEFSFVGDQRAKLRSTALNSMLLALEALDQLGDEVSAAIALQHAIDCLSYRESGFDKITAVKPLLSK